MSKISIIMTPKERADYSEALGEMLGIQVQEDTNSAYCPISATLTPQELKPVLASRQKILMQEILGKAGIKAYDPGTAKYSPDLARTAPPSEVYNADAGKVLSSRFFAGHHLIASSGFGTEQQLASLSNRISVILMDADIRISRMQPSRMIYLQYSNLEQQAERLSQVFQMLKEFEPGIGFDSKVPCLLGFRAHNVVNLEKEVYSAFPDLKYNYDGNAPIAELTAKNPRIFRELAI